MVMLLLHADTDKPYGIGLWKWAAAARDRQTDRQTVSRTLGGTQEEERRSQRKKKKRRMEERKKISLLMLLLLLLLLAAAASFYPLMHHDAEFVCHS